MTTTSTATAAHDLTIRGSRTAPDGYGHSCSCSPAIGYGYARQSDVKAAHAAHVAQAAAGIVAP